MTDYLRHLITTSFLVFAPGLPVVAHTITRAAVPHNIQVPAGHAAFLSAQGRGTQNYMCLPSASGFSWTFLGPQATLFLKLSFVGRENEQQITTHFFSPNPDEGGTPTVTWLHSLDSSAVWGRAVATSTDPAFVAAGAIPWLLVQAVGKEPGLTGSNILGQATFIHRVNTTGGIAPTTPCGSSTIGARTFVPYTADYIFYRAAADIDAAL